MTSASACRVASSKRFLKAALTYPIVFGAAEHHGGMRIQLGKEGLQRLRMTLLFEVDAKRGQRKVPHAAEAGLSAMIACRPDECLPEPCPVPGARDMAVARRAPDHFSPPLPSQRWLPCRQKMLPLSPGKVLRSSAISSKLA